MNVVGIMIGITEKVQQCIKKIPNHLKMRCTFVQVVFIFTFLALDIKIISEIAKGKQMEMEMEMKREMEMPSART